MTTQPLDVRTLEPRDRHRTIFETLGGLNPRETLRLINDHDPAPLRYQLDAEHPHQFGWEYVESGPERWVIDITSRVTTFDARPTIAAGGEPFAAIMEAAATVKSGEVLVIFAPFEPVPLEGILGEEGFDHVAEQIDDNNWRVTFTRT